MKISFTKKEYRDLLDILYIANWILSAHKVDDDPETKRYMKLQQRPLSFAKEMGLENLVEYVSEFQKHFPSKEYVDTSSAIDVIEKFEHDTFWDQLITRLSERDMIRQVGGDERVKKFSVEELFEKMIPFEDKYATEFETNGLDNLEN